MTLTLLTSNTKPAILRLVNSLLTDIEAIQKITKRLTQYFQENDTVDSTPTTLWAAHKCVIRGELRSIAAKGNKHRKARIEDLSTRIHALKQAHKLSEASNTLSDLLKAREELLEVLGNTLQRKYVLTHKPLYEFGNKSGKLLARALQLKKAASTIHTIKDPSGNAFVTPEDIANQFVRYFSKLYNLHTAQSRQDRHQTAKRQL